MSGRKPISSNAAQLSSRVMPRSALMAWEVDKWDTGAVEPLPEPVEAER